MKFDELKTRVLLIDEKAVFQIAMLPGENRLAAWVYFSDGTGRGYYLDEETK